MVSDAEVWWNMMGNYAPLKPYLEHLGIDASSIRQIHDSWRGLGEEAALGGNPNLLNQNAALAYFKSKYPTINQSMQTITTTANPINSNFSNEEFNKLVSQFNLDIAQQMATVKTIGGHTYGYWRKYAPSFAVNMGDSVAELIANQRGLELETLKASFPNVFVETYPTPITEPEPELITSCYMVHGQKLELSQDAVDYYKSIGVSVTPCYVEPSITEPEPEPPITKPPITEPETVPIQEPPIMPTQNPGESCEEYRGRLQSLGWYVEWQSDCPPHTPITTPGIPGKFNTNILVGLLAGGVLAVPILDDLLKTKKKRRK